MQPTHCPRLARALARVLAALPHSTTDMTVCTEEPKKLEEQPEQHGVLKRPAWLDRDVASWGTALRVPEWVNDDGSYRRKNGWMGSDYMHCPTAAVRIPAYYVSYGSSCGSDVSTKKTTLIGPVEFTTGAESHRGYCHGGTMCAVMDDVVGWVAFCATGTCRPWSGFTVQVNTALRKPVPVGSTLLVRSEITAVERRKVFVKAVLEDPDCEGAVHAECDGVVVLNKGVLAGTC